MFIFGMRTLHASVSLAGLTLGRPAPSLNDKGARESYWSIPQRTHIQKFHELFCLSVRSCPTLQCRLPDGPIVESVLSLMLQPTSIHPLHFEQHTNNALHTIVIYLAWTFRFFAIENAAVFGYCLESRHVWFLLLSNSMGCLRSWLTIVADSVDVAPGLIWTPLSRSTRYTRNGLKTYSWMDCAKLI